MAWRVRGVRATIVLQTEDMEDIQDNFNQIMHDKDFASGYILDPLIP